MLAHSHRAIRPKYHITILKDIKRYNIGLVKRSDTEMIVSLTKLLIIALNQLLPSYNVCHYYYFLTLFYIHLCVCVCV